MFLSILFIILCFTYKHKRHHRNSDVEEDDIIEIENMSNFNGNPEFYKNYWERVYKELSFYIFKCLGLLLCFYFDIMYIYNTYLSE